MKTTKDNNQLTHQIGEHLVAAKLGRLGYVATPFVGKSPAVHLRITNDRGRFIPIQVKAIKGPSWQFQIDTFLDVEIVDDVQHIRGKLKLPNPSLVCILVQIAKKENDEYYILQLKNLQEFFFKTYKGGKRPQNPQSLHCAVWPRDLIRFKDNWGLIEKALKSKT